MKEKPQRLGARVRQSNQPTGRSARRNPKRCLFGRSDHDELNNDLENMQKEIITRNLGKYTIFDQSGEEKPATELLDKSGKETTENSPKIR